MPPGSNTKQVDSLAARLDLAGDSWRSSLSLEGPEFASALRTKEELNLAPKLAAALQHADTLFEAALLACGIPPPIADQVLLLATRHQALAIALATQTEMIGSMQLQTPENSTGLIKVMSIRRPGSQDRNSIGNTPVVTYSGLELLGESAEHGHHQHHHALHHHAAPAAAAGDEHDEGEEDGELDDDDSDRASVGTGTFFTSEAAYELYDRLGGWDVLSAAVQNMYNKLYSDPRTAVFFQHSDHTKLMRHMTCFIGSALAGKILYSPRKIWLLHRHHIQDMGMNAMHVDIMAEHLQGVLSQLGTQQSVIDDAVQCLQEMRWVFTCADSFVDPAETEARYQLRTQNSVRGMRLPNCAAAGAQRGPSAGQVRSRPGSQDSAPPPAAFTPVPSDDGRPSRSSRSQVPAPVLATLAESEYSGRSAASDGDAPAAAACKAGAKGPCNQACPASQQPRGDEDAVVRVTSTQGGEASNEAAAAAPKQAPHPLMGAAGGVCPFAHMMKK